MNHSETHQSVEKLLTMAEAAKQLGLPYRKIQRAVRDELIPHHKLQNSRKLVRISEILRVIDGGRHDQ